MTKRGDRRKAYETALAEAVRRIRDVEARFLDFSDQFPGTDGSLADRAKRMERLNAEELETAAEYLEMLSVATERARLALFVLQSGG